MTEKNAPNPIPVLRIVETRANSCPRISACVGFWDAGRESDGWLSNVGEHAFRRDPRYDIEMRAYTRDFGGKGMLTEWECRCSAYMPGVGELEHILPAMRRIDKAMHKAREEGCDDSYGAAVVAFARAVKAQRVDYTTVDGRTERLSLHNLRQQVQDRADAFADGNHLRPIS